MRPTLLNFRSPYEKTPDYYNISMTNNGDKLNFRPKSVIQKPTTMSQARRFQESTFYSKGTGASCYNGPGAYNDHDNYLKLN